MISFEINLRKEKLLFVSIYKPQSIQSIKTQNNQYLLDILGNLVNFYSEDYDNKVILGNFNFEPCNPSIASFMNRYVYFWLEIILLLMVKVRALI